MTIRDDLKLTPFHDYFASEYADTLEYDEWGVYNAPVVCSNIKDESIAMRNGCAVLDMSPMTKYRIFGADAGAFLDMMMTRKCSNMPADRVRYVIWVNEQGKAFDDGTLFCFSSDEFVLYCAEDATEQMAFIKQHFTDVNIEDATHESSAMAFTGPTSYDVLKAMGIEGLQGLKGFQFVHTSYNGHDIVVSRTGFTGDLGFEIWFPLTAVDDFWQAYQTHKAQYDMRLIGLGTLEVGRIEAGFVIPGYDFALAALDEEVEFRRSPFELNLGFLVDSDRDYYGSEALKAEQESGSSFQFAGVEVESDAPFFEYGLPLFCEVGGEAVEAGVLTSSCWSEQLQKNIAVVSLAVDYSANETFWVDVPEGEQGVVCKKASLPFYKTDRRDMPLS